MSKTLLKFISLSNRQYVWYRNFTDFTSFSITFYMPLPTGGNNVYNIMYGDTQTQKRNVIFDNKHLTVMVEECNRMKNHSQLGQLILLRLVGV